MKRAILGYIVSGPEGRAYGASTGHGGQRALFICRHVDVFPSRGAAHRLIRETVAYARTHGLDWGAADRYRVVPVKAAPR